MLGNKKVFSLTISALIVSLLFVKTDRAQEAPPMEGNYILNLYDAFGPDAAGSTQDFGFSAIIYWNDNIILFDAGSNADIFKNNVEALGVDLREVDFAIASHSHFDHINGFDYLLEVNPEVKIYFPNDPFFGAPLYFNVSGMDTAASNNLSVEQKYFRGEKTKFTFSQSGRFWGADVEFVTENKEIAPGINLISTRSPFMGYFSRYPNMGITGEKEDSEINTIDLPELSLSLRTSSGEVLIVGCSHSLVETITRETKEHLKNDIALVMGGYHLLPYKEDEIREMAERMKNELGVKSVAPAHCTGHLGFKVFKSIYGNSYFNSGLGTILHLPK